MRGLVAVGVTPGIFFRTRRGYLAALKHAGRDASVHNLAGSWIAGRRLGA